MDVTKNSLLLSLRSLRSFVLLFDRCI